MAFLSHRITHGLFAAALGVATIPALPRARADVTYLSATRTTHGDWYYGPESPSTAGDFTATDFAPFNHTSGDNGSLAAGTATLHSTLNPASIVSSGDCYASGNHANGFDFYGEATTKQFITIQVTQPTNLWYESITYTIAGPGGHGVSARFRPTGGTYQNIPTTLATAVLLQPGTYDIDAEAYAYGSPNGFGLYGHVTYSDAIHFDAAATPCAADYDHSGDLAVTDIFAYLNGWFAGEAAADINHSGGLEIQDIFDFLNAWFAGCP
jgi:hypothetical protein